MLDVQDFFILGSRMGLLTDLIIFGNFLLKGRTFLAKGLPVEGAEPGDLDVSLQGSQLAPQLSLGVPVPQGTSLLPSEPTTRIQAHLACAALITERSLNSMFLRCSALAQPKDESLPGLQRSPNPSTALPPPGDKHRPCHILHTQI